MKLLSPQRIVFDLVQRVQENDVLKAFTTLNVDINQDLVETKPVRLRARKRIQLGTLITKQTSVVAVTAKVGT